MASPDKESLYTNIPYMTMERRSQPRARPASLRVPRSYCHLNKVKRQTLSCLIKQLASYCFDHG